MRAEIAKLRFLPLPRWTAAVVVAVPIIAAGFLFGYRPKEAGTYIATMTIVCSTLFSVAAVVVGVWFAALESAAGTMQRTLTAEPNRNRVLASKLVVAVVFVGLLAVASSAAGCGLTHLAAVNGNVDLSPGTLARWVFSYVPVAMISAAVGFGFGLLSRSIGGGVTLALGFVFVLDGALSFIDRFKPYAYGQLTGDLTNNLGNRGIPSHGLGVAALGLLIWLAIIITPGWLLFLRADLN